MAHLIRDIDHRLAVALRLQEARTAREVGLIASEITQTQSTFAVHEDEDRLRVVWTQSHRLRPDQYIEGALEQTVAWSLSAHGARYGLWFHHIDASNPNPDIAWLRELTGRALHRTMVYEGLIAARDSAQLHIDQLANLATVVSTLDPAAALQSLMHAAVSMTDSETGFAIVCRPNACDITVDWGLGPVLDELRLKSSDDSLLSAVLRGETYILQDAEQVDATLKTAPCLETLTNLWGLPLLHQGQCLGTLILVNSKSAYSFVEPQIESALKIGSTALQNALLHQGSLEREKLLEQLRVAGEIQRKLLPAGSGAIGNLQFAASAVPCDACGGDYFDHIALKSGRIALILGDVTGHGVPAAILVTAAQATVRAVLDTESDLSVAVHEMNRLFNREFTEDRFITLVVLLIDPETGRLEYVNAGHAPPLFIYRAREATIEEFKSTGPPLGMLPGVPYDTGVIEPLGPDDGIYILSDGIHEAVSQTEGMLGLDRTKEFIHEHRALRPQEFVARLQSYVADYVAPGARNDDSTVLCVRPNHQNGEASTSLQTSNPS
ncbi:MAG: PP2C family protein-serine/threonine phosphatase [Myxococcota bacterium]